MVVAAILSVAEALMSDFDPQRMILSSVRITAPDPTMLPPQSFGGPEERQQQRGVKDAVRVSCIARETSTCHPTPASNPVKGNQTGPACTWQIRVSNRRKDSEHLFLCTQVMSVEVHNSIDYQKSASQALPSP